MQNELSPCCCKGTAAGVESRRGFCGQLTAIVCGAVALLVPAATGVVAFLNPLRQKSQAGRFMRLAALDALPEDGTPRKLPVIADRIDAWSRFPAEPIGAVFLRRVGNDVSALQVLCPHANCSINFESSPQGGKFFCPCHAASFNLSGKRTDPTSPSPRNMDTLEVEIRNKNEVWVKFENFRMGIAAKVVQS